MQEVQGRSSTKDKIVLISWVKHQQDEVARLKTIKIQSRINYMLMNILKKEIMEAKHLERTTSPLPEIAGSRVGSDDCLSLGGGCYYVFWKYAILTL
jgi:hypothetical protein